VRVDGVGLSQLINIKGLNDILGKLAAGDKLDVQIVEISGNEITLRLPNGQNVSATTTSALQLSLGDFLTLSVKSKSENQIIFQTVADMNEQVKLQNIEDTLMSLKISPDDRNFEIGSEMINQHIPLNKENLKAVMNVLGMFEGMDVQKAVFIVANNIQSVPGGKEMLEQFENNNISVGKSINNLINMLALSIDSDNLDSIFLSFHDEVASRLVDNIDQRIQNLIGFYAGATEEDIDFINLFIKQSIAQSDNPDTFIETLIKHNVTSNDLKYLLEPEDNKELFKFIDKNPTLKENLINFLNDKGPLEKFILDFTKNNPSIFQRYNDLGYDNTVDRLRAFFKDIVNNIKEGRIKNEINVNKLYNDIDLKLNVLEKHLQKYDVPNGDHLFKVIGEIKSEISFIKNIDNMFNFYQLPFVINKNNASVDMYIMKNSREHRIIDPNNASLYISLNTKNLGQVDVLVHVQSKIVDFNFKLQDDKTINFFEKRQSMLEDILSKKGYTANNIRFSLNPRRTNLVNFENIIREERNIVKDVFDVKI
jgi:hypothetical protein